MDFRRTNDSNASLLVSDSLPSGTVRTKAPPLSYRSERTCALVLGDASALVFASVLASVIIDRFWNANLDYGRILASAIISCTVCLLVFERLGLYRLSFAQSIRDQFYYVTAAVCITILPQIVVFSIFPEISSSRAVLGITLLLAVPIVGAFRAISHALLDAPALQRKMRLAIIGDPTNAQQVSGTLQSVERVETLFLNAHSDSRALLERARAWGADKVIFATIPPAETLRNLLVIAREAKVPLGFAAPAVPLNDCALSLERIGDQMLIVPERMPMDTLAARCLKRTIDIISAAVALAIALPVMAVIALVLWLQRQSPVVYRQERVGAHGRVFTMFKFRSMSSGAEEKCGPVWAKPGDGRATRFGAFLRRTSLDELPQLFNVLRGDMSIVGPRPERPFFVEMFRLMLPRYDERHRVKPGITGWSQVHMPRILDPAVAGEKLAFDLFYIRHWSLFMDISIIFKTAVEFLFHKAA
ncbi:MAG: sugar transferase [Candidatus Eremiobacteraeota bacterium]|nr:sugar transferase [Candidatus Eremiobacteraeota bacterium]